MKISISAILSWLFLLSLFLTCSPAEVKTDFSGNYTFNPKKSRLQIPIPESMTVFIVHQEPDWKFIRVFIERGKKDESTIELIVNGPEVVKKDGDKTELSKLYWDGKTLVLSQRIHWKKREATNVVKYSLSSDRQILEARESFRGPILKYDNVWIFERNS